MPVRRRISYFVFAVVILVLLRMGFEPAGGLLVGFAVITPLEILFRRHPQPVRRPGLRTDMVHLLLSGLLLSGFAIVAIVAWAIVLLPFRAVNLGRFAHAQPFWLQAIETFLLFELVAYWAHRALHEVDLFWRFHSVHHSSPRLDWISGARTHPVEGLIVGAMIAPPLLILGVNPQSVGVLTVITNLWGVLLHANIRWRFAWMDGWWGTPDYHHWHHSNHAEARNKNYAAFLPMFDRWFGSYYQPKDRRPELYGIDEPMPIGWIGQMRQPFRQLFRRRCGAAAPAINEDRSSAHATRDAP